MSLRNAVPYAYYQQLLSPGPYYLSKAHKYFNRYDLLEGKAK